MTKGTIIRLKKRGYATRVQTPWEVVLAARRTLLAAKGGTATFCERACRHVIARQSQNNESRNLDSCLFKRS
jgi:hypothetical protein